MSKLKIGDILEITTPKGLAYVQFAFYRKPYGTLIRVLPEIYQSRPKDFSQIAQGKELYFVFCPIEALVAQGLLGVVANEKIPDSAAEFPVMRKRGFVKPIAKGGGVSHWIIWDGDKETRVEKLTAEQARLSIASNWNLGMLVNRLAGGWRPEMDAGLPSSGQATRQGHPKTKLVRHYLYVPGESVALSVQRRLAGVQNVEVKPSARGPQWLVLVYDSEATEHSISQMRTELENVAVEFKGEYDGWEIEVE